MLLFNSALCESMGVYASTLIHVTSRNEPAIVQANAVLGSVCVWHVGLEYLNSEKSW